MIWHELDPERLIGMLLHEGGPVTEADVALIEAACAELGKLAVGRFAVSFVIVESDHGPDARQRKRIAAAANSMARCYDVLVTKSAATRAIMTAIRWMTPADANRVQTTYATYEDARAYLVDKTGHPAAAFDALRARLRARVAAR